MLGYYYTLAEFAPYYSFLHGLVVVVAFIAVLSPNLYYSVISLLVVYFLSGCIMIALGAEYLGLVLIIVYVGAIAVLFIFVVMLFDYNVLQQNVRPTWLLALVLVLFFSITEYLLADALFLPSLRIANFRFLTLDAHSLQIFCMFQDPIVYLGIYMFNFYFLAVAGCAFLLLLALIIAVLLLQVVRDQLYKPTVKAGHSPNEIPTQSKLSQQIYRLYE
jgi:NADH:ubiquinone oxidoreductase subunit 6 (subunit J)